MLKFRYLLLASLIVFSVGGKSQSLRPFIKNYTTKDYGDAINPQSWSVSQDSRGIVYFGNSLKLIEFDGENWNQLNTSASGAYVTSILPDSSLRIYVGAQGEFGYLFPNNNGEYIYTSLTGSLEDSNKPSDNVWKTLKYKDGIIFFTQQKLFFYSNDSIKILKPKTIFHNIFIVEGELYVRQRDIGLMKFENNEFKLLPNGDIFKDDGVFGMYKNPKSNKILISTQEIGSYNLTPNGIEKIETKDETLLNNSLIFGGIELNDGNIALRTAQNGVVIIDFNANVKNIFNKEVGLLDNDVKQIFQGKEGSLWLAMNSGLAKINYTSQISYYKDKSGLSGRVKSITKFNNTLFVGTSDGLYVEDTLFPIYNRKYYKAINEGVLSISKSNDDLFIGTKNNLLVLNKETSNLTVIDRIDASSTYWSKKKELLYIVGDNGLAIYKKQLGAFKKIAFDDWAMIHDVTTLVEDEKHDDGKTYLWAGSLNSGVINYIIDKDLNISPPDIYRGENGGLDKGWTNLFKHNNSFVAATVTGLMSLIDAETIKETFKDSTLIQDRGMFNFSNLYHNSATYIYLLEQNQLIWSCIEGGIVMQNQEDTNIISKPFKSIDLENIVSLFPETEKELWVGADKGIAFVDLKVEKAFNTKPNINIRKVTIGTDSVIFAGLFFDKKNNTVVNKQEKSLVPVIDYSLNNISIKFASICDEDGKKAEYSFMLEGYDTDWSEWGRTNYSIYKKIPSGSYTFLVKSRSIYGNESEVFEYKFVVLPPWYDTILAYIIYFILFIALVYAIVILSIKRLKAKNEELERVVQERTKEISEQRDVLAEQKQEIEDSINYAKRIQEAVMPHSEYIEKIMNDYFILFRPKDVVSGDFYWSIKIGNKIIITAADCTGHGVPGAFMSMLGISFLNQIVKMEGVTHAHQILNKLRTNIIYALKQKGLISEQKDGMDMSLCVIDTETNKVDFAGANNPLYVVTTANELKVSEGATVKLNEGLFDEELDYKLFEVKGDKMPIAIYEKMDDFYNNEIQLEKGDCIYMFSDGYADQFGGPKGKKFKYKPFKRLVLGNSQKSMQEQKELLEKSFVDWHEGYDQIDDVVVIGIRI